MSRSRNVRVSPKWLALLVAVSLGGCAGEPELKRFVPSSIAAQTAVETVLLDWQADWPPRYREDLSPAVGVVDQHRRPGQKLVGFELLGEVPGPAPRCFAVHLRLADPQEEETVRYVVVGDDPLWVFRDQDFDMLAHWDHVMPDPADADVVGDKPPTESVDDNAHRQGQDSPTEEPTP